MKASLITALFLTHFQVVISQEETQSYIIGVNRSEHNVSIMDANSYEIIKKVPVGIGPHEVAVSSDGTYAVVFNYGEYPQPHENPISSNELQWVARNSYTVTKIDLTRLEATDTWVLADCSKPHHGVISEDGESLWCTCETEKKVVQLDTNTGHEINSWNMDQEQTHFLLKTHDKIVTTNIQSNTVSFIDLITNKIRTLAVGKNPEGIGISPDQSELWILCYGENKIYIVDPIKEEVIHIMDSQSRFPIEIQWLTNEVWVSNVTSREVTVYDNQSRQLIHRIPLPSTGLGLLMSPDGQRAYVSLPRLNKVQVIDTQTRQVIDEFSSGIETDGLVWFDKISVN